MLLGLFFWAGKFLFTNWYNILIDISISGKTTSPSFSWTGKTTSPSFMVDGEVNLPEKSGVVTAEITFTLCTNSFGSEDSWRLSLTDYTNYTDFIFDWSIGSSFHADFADYADFIYDWSIGSSWVICATKVTSKVKVTKAQMTPDLHSVYPASLLEGCLTVNSVLKSSQTLF